MKDYPLPAELSRFSNLPDLQYRGGDEWSASCPHCGGAGGKRYDKSDRFRLFGASTQANARVWCRQCGHFEWADQKKNFQVDPELAKARQELAKREQQRLRAKIDALRREAYWQGYHDAMTEKQREFWRREGISDGLQDYFRLGYTPEHNYGFAGQTYTSPAMTIPVFDVGWKATNVQYRLLKPQQGAGKYRYTPGLPAPLYITDPDCEPHGPTILVEGAKKAIVIFAHLGHKYYVVAVPSKAPSPKLFEKLNNCEPIYIALDPDAYTDKFSARRVGEIVGDRARFLRLPAKPDDLLTQYEFSPWMFENYIKVATKEC